MTKPLLLSIKPQYAAKIYSGQKKTEIRKTCPDIAPCEMVIIYETAPKKAITGWFLIDNISQHYNPENYTEYAVKYGAITEQEYLDYIDGSKKVVFIDIADRRRTKTAKLDTLRQYINDFVIPMSYRYLSMNEFLIINDLMAGVMNNGQHKFVTQPN